MSRCRWEPKSLTGPSGTRPTCPACGRPWCKKCQRHFANCVHRRDVGGVNRYGQQWSMMWKRINEVGAPGLGGWHRAWEYVDSYAIAYNEALLRRIQFNNIENRDKLLGAELALVEAWELAKEAWLEAGCPQNHNTPEQRAEAHKNVKRFNPIITTNGAEHDEQNRRLLGQAGDN